MCHSRPASLLIVLSFLLSISACGGGGGGGGSDGSASYTIGGTVTGAVNSGLALENNGVTPWRLEESTLNLPRNWPMAAVMT